PRDCVRAFCRPPAAPVLHTLPLHDALPIYVRPGRDGLQVRRIAAAAMLAGLAACTPQVVVVARVVDLVALGRVTVAEPVGDPVGDVLIPERLHPRLAVPGGGEDRAGPGPAGVRPSRLIDPTPEVIRRSATIHGDTHRRGWYTTHQLRCEALSYRNGSSTGASQPRYLRFWQARIYHRRLLRREPGECTGT